MKILLVVALLAMCAAKAYPADPLVDVPRFLAAIAEKEQNGHGNPYGITTAVWRDRMDGLPYELVHDPHYSRLCALKHVNWLANELHKHGVKPDCYALAAAWHEGINGFLELNRYHQPVQYGTEIENLYNHP